MGIDISYQPDMMQVGQLAFNSAAQQAANKMQLYRDQNQQRSAERMQSRAWSLEDQANQQQAAWLDDSIKVAEKTAHDLKSVYTSQNLSPEGRVTWAELQGKLKAVQKQRSFLTPQAYAELMGKWIGDVEMSGMDNHVIKVPTPEEDFNQNVIDVRTGKSVDWNNPPPRVAIRKRDSHGNFVWSFEDIAPKESAGQKYDPVKDEKTARENVERRIEAEMDAKRAADEAEFKRKQAEQKAHEESGTWFKGEGPHPGILEQQFNRDDPAYKRPPTQAEIDAEMQRLQGLRGAAAPPVQLSTPGPQQQAAPQPQAPPQLPFPLATPEPSQQPAQEMPGQAAPQPAPEQAPQPEQQVPPEMVQVGKRQYPKIQGTILDTDGSPLKAFQYEVGGQPIAAVLNKDGTISALQQREDGRFDRAQQIIDPDIQKQEQKKPVSVMDVINALPQNDSDAEAIKKLILLIGRQKDLDPTTWSAEDAKELQSLGGKNGPVWIASAGLGAYLDGSQKPSRFFGYEKEADLHPGVVYSGVVIDGVSYKAIWNGSAFIPIHKE